MSTYKRRIVYLSDEEWEQLGRIAKVRKVTISATIRGLLRGPTAVEGSPEQADAFVIARLDTEKFQLVDSVDTTPRRSAQAQRDELLRKINRGKS